MSIYKAISQECKLEVGGGIRHHQSGGKSTSLIEITIADELSGQFIAEITLTPDQFMKLLSGTMGLKVDGAIANQTIRERWGMVEVREQVTVPEDVAEQARWSKDRDTANGVISEWFEDQPESVGIDNYWINRNVSMNNPKAAIVTTIKWVTQEVADELKARRELAMTADDDEDGLDDD